MPQLVQSICSSANTHKRVTQHCWTDGGKFHQHTLAALPAQGRHSRRRMSSLDVDTPAALPIRTLRCTAGRASRRKTCTRSRRSAPPPEMKPHKEHSPRQSTVGRLHVGCQRSSVQDGRRKRRPPRRRRTVGFTAPAAALQWSFCCQAAPNAISISISDHRPEPRQVAT